MLFKMVDVIAYAYNYYISILLVWILKRNGNMLLSVAMK